MSPSSNEGGISSLSKLCEPEMWLATLEDDLFVFFCPGLAAKTSFECVRAISRVYRSGKGRRQQGSLRIRWERRSKNRDKDKDEDEQGKTTGIYQ